MTRRWPDPPFDLLGLPNERIIDYGHKKLAMYTCDYNGLRFWAWSSSDADMPIRVISDKVKAFTGPEQQFLDLMDSRGWSRSIIFADDALHAACLIHAKAQELTHQGNPQDTIAG